jgi:DNA-binding GntR family transcriptional regulator
MELDRRLPSSDVPSGPSLFGTEPVSTPLTRRQAVLERLRSNIVSGALPPGTLLRETSLAAHLEVSATPVREALGTLEAEGLVEIEVHRLKRVARIDFRGMRDLLRVQSELWRLGYIWGMPHVGAGQVAQLEHALARYRTCLASDDSAGALTAGLDFHTIFIAASRNRELLRSTLDRRALIARFVLLHGLQTICPLGLSQHEAILAAFLANDRSAVLAGVDRIATRLIALAVQGREPSDDVAENQKI